MRIHILPIFIALLVLSGCGGDPSRPKDLPQLFSVKISVTQENKPLEGATVTLHNKTPSKYGASSEKTDASGLAVLRTYGYEGAPAGEYAVTITKKGVEGAREAKTPEGQPMSVGGRIYGYIDKQFSERDTTPLSVSVSDKALEETFEVGTPVHDFLGNVP